MGMTKKDWQDIEAAIAQLGLKKVLKKVLKLKINGIKVKVKRNENGSYDTYLNGQWVTDDDDSKMAYDLVKSLLTDS